MAVVEETTLHQLYEHFITLFKEERRRDSHSLVGGLSPCVSYGVVILAQPNAVLLWRATYRREGDDVKARNWCSEDAILHVKTTTPVEMCHLELNIATTFHRCVSLHVEVDQILFDSDCSKRACCY